MCRLALFAVLLVSCGSATPCQDTQVHNPPDPGVSNLPSLSVAASSETGARAAAQDPNPPGTTLLSDSVFVDPEPPPGFVQCAGFINTSGDDVQHNFLDRCLNAARLRVRVWDGDRRLEEDLWSGDLTPNPEWPNFNYLGSETFAEVRTHWGSTAFFSTTDGRDACMHQAAPAGVVFGSGNGDIAGGAGAGDEYRLSCGGADLLGRRIAIYRDAQD